MKNNRFCRGQRVVMGEREYVIEKRLPGGNLQLKDIITNIYTDRTLSELVDALFKGNLVMLPDEQRMPYIREKVAGMLAADFTQLPEEDREKAKRKYSYVTGVIEAGLDSKTRGTLGPVIKAVSRSIGDPNPPSWIQVYRWHRDYKASGEDIRSLVPLHKEKGNRKRRIAGEVIAILDAVVNEKYLTKQRLSPISIYDAVVVRVAHENLLRDPGDQIRMPSHMAVYRHVDKLDPFEVMKARFGKAAADLKYSPKKQGVRPTRPLERVEIDHTKLDVFVVDMERRMPIGRPCLTTAIDVYTKSIVGMHVSFNPPSYLSLMQCMLHAISPKTYVRHRYPGIQHEWDAYGLMETAVVDNAKEFRSAHFEDACLQLGIVIQHAPVRLAWYKPSIERYFGTLNTRLLHRQPGTSFSNIFDRRDYDPAKNAIIDFPTLMEVVHKWIVDVYHYEEHRGIHDIPALRWKKAIEEFPPALPPNKKELEVLLGMIEERIVSASGIELHGLFYNDDSLAALRRRGRKEGKVKIKYDPNDLSVIHVLDSDSNAFIPVASVNMEYTAGLTLWQHDVIRRYTREYIDKNCDMVSMAQAKEEIGRIVEDAWNTSKKSGTRQKAARWKKISQEGAVGIIQPPIEGQTVQKGLILPMAPGQCLDHISDIGAPAGCKGGMGGKETPSAEKRTGMVMGTQKDKKPRGKRKKKSGLKEMAKDGAPKHAGNPEDDFNLDMTGWDATYTLPKQGGK